MIKDQGDCPERGMESAPRYGLFRYCHPKPDISLRRLGDAKGHTETSVASAGSE